MPNHYETIVIGLGAMGSATTYQLAKRGVNVLGIDRFEPPHTMGSTHGESRVTRLAVGEGPEYIPLVRRTHEIWRELEEQTDIPVLETTGGLIVCPMDATAAWHGDEDFVLRTAQVADQFDIAHEVLSAENVRERFPTIKFPDGFHALYEPTGGLANPEGAITAQLQLAKQHGATLHTGETVLDVNSDDDGVTVTTDKGEYRADKIVVSAGAWVRDFLPEQFQKEVNVYRQVFYWFEAEDSDTYKGGNFPWVLWIGRTLPDYMGMFPITRWVDPLVKILTEQFHEICDAETVEREVSSAEIEHMHTLGSKYFDGITPTCVRTKVCLYTTTSDEHFIIDYLPDNDRILVASPCSGHGFKHSAAIGESIAQWLHEGESAIDLGLFSFGRFS